MRLQCSLRFCSIHVVLLHAMLVVTGLHHSVGGEFHFTSFELHDQKRVSLPLRRYDPSSTPTNISGTICTAMSNWKIIHTSQMAARIPNSRLDEIGGITPTLTLIYIITSPHSPNMYPGMQLSRRPYTSEDTWRAPLRYRAKVLLGFRVSHADTSRHVRMLILFLPSRAIHACD